MDILLANRIKVGAVNLLLVLILNSCIYRVSKDDVAKAKKECGLKNESNDDLVITFYGFDKNELNKGVEFKNLKEQWSMVRDSISIVSQDDGTYTGVYIYTGVKRTSDSIELRVAEKRSVLTNFTNGPKIGVSGMGSEGIAGCRLDSLDIDGVRVSSQALTIKNSE